MAEAVEESGLTAGHGGGCGGKRRSRLTADPFAATMSGAMEKRTRMEDQFLRLRMLVGDEGISRLQASRVAVFGLGGVGGYAVEALARSGIGTLDLIDHDTVEFSNLNRQILATHDTVGRAKIEVARARILSINPGIQLRCHQTFYLPETAGQFAFHSYDYVIDAIDTVSGKIELVLQARAAGVPIISCMGAGNKMDASKLRVADLYETTGCPLARVIRRELKKRGVPSLKVVYSTEKARTPLSFGEEAASGGGEQKVRRQTPGSTAIVPAVAGLLAAGEVIRELLRSDDDADGAT